MEKLGQLQDNSEASDEQPNTNLTDVTYGHDYQKGKHLIAAGLQKKGKAALPGDRYPAEVIFAYWELRDDAQWAEETRPSQQTSIS